MCFPWGASFPPSSEKNKQKKKNRCDAKCHVRCLNLTAVPEGDWFCSSCVSERTVPFSLFNAENPAAAEKAFYEATNPSTPIGEWPQAGGRQRASTCMYVTVRPVSE